MAKILLVEDDNNLREIYEARLLAEGYEIVSARDGEEALTIAMKERPDLIISDVMMPKISGFDMLDIIRSTEETKNVKVIMMTALSQAEDKARAEKLGADRYLVKSQVTLEDVAKVAREVLSGESAPTTDTAPAADDSTPVSPPTPDPAPVAAATAPPTPIVADPVVVPVPATIAVAVDPVAATAPVTPAVDPLALSSITPTSTPVPEPATDQPEVVSEESAIAAQIESFIDTKKNIAVPATPVEVEAEPQPATEESAHAQVVDTPTKKRIIQPLNDPNVSAGPSLDALLQKEAEKDEMAQIAHGMAQAKEQSDDSDTQSSETQESSTQNDGVHVQEVAINEDGSIVAQSDESSTAPTPPVEAPSVQPVPQTNGNNIDGVVQPQQPVITPPATPDAGNGVDPNSIAL